MNVKVSCFLILRAIAFLWLLGEAGLGERRVCLLTLKPEKGHILTSVSLLLLAYYPQLDQKSTEWVSPHCFLEGNACWRLTMAWTMARDPQFILLLSRVLYKFPLKSVSSSIWIIPWCWTHFVLVKMPSCIRADFILTFLLEAFSMSSTVKCIKAKDTQYKFIPKSSVPPPTWSRDENQMRPQCYLCARLSRLPAVLSPPAVSSCLRSLGPAPPILISTRWLTLCLSLICFSAILLLCPD